MFLKVFFEKVYFRKKSADDNKDSKQRVRNRNCHIYLGYLTKCAQIYKFPFNHVVSFNHLLVWFVLISMELF